jgi:hypothetical protein
MSQAAQGRNVTLEHSQPTPELQPQPPIGRQRLVGSVLGMAAGVVAGILLLSGVMPAGFAFLAPVLGGIGGAAAGDRVVQYALAPKQKQPREQEREPRDRKREASNEKEAAKDRSVEKEKPQEVSQEKPIAVIDERHMRPLKAAGIALLSASQLAATLQPQPVAAQGEGKHASKIRTERNQRDPRYSKNRVINGVEVPEHVYQQIKKRYDPNTLSPQQLTNAVKGAFVDGKVFDDDKAKYGFDDELHVDHHERDDHHHDKSELVSADAHSAIKDILAKGPRRQKEGYAPTLEDERLLAAFQEKQTGAA